MGYVLLIIYALFCFVSPPVAVVFIILYITRGKEIKKLKAQINYLKSNNAVPEKEPLKVETKTPAVVVPAPKVQVQPKVSNPVPNNPVTNQVPKKKKEKVSSINVTFGVGVLLLTVVGAFFITASWSFMSAPVRCMVLLFVAALVYFLSFVSGKLLKLSQTGFSFYCLGTFLLPIIILGIGGLKAFGDGFNLSTNPGIVGGIAFLAFGLSGLIGTKIFKSNFHMGISYFGMTWMILFIISEIFEHFIIGSFIAIAVIAIISLLLNRFIPGIKGMGTYSTIMTFASSISFFCFFNEYVGTIFAIVLSAVAFTLLCKFKWKNIVYFLPFAYLLTAINGFVVFVSDNSNLIIASVYFMILVAIIYLVLEVIRAKTIVSDFVCYLTLVYMAIIDFVDKYDIYKSLLAVLLLVVASLIFIRTLISKKSGSIIKSVEAGFLVINYALVALAFNEDKSKAIAVVIITILISLVRLININFVRKEIYFKVMAYVAIILGSFFSLIATFDFQEEPIAIFFSVFLSIFFVVGIINSIISRRQKPSVNNKKNPLIITFGTLIILNVPLCVLSFVSGLDLGISYSYLNLLIPEIIYVATLVTCFILSDRGFGRIKKYFNVFSLVISITAGVISLVGPFVFDKVNSWLALIIDIVLIASMCFIKDTRSLILPAVSTFLIALKITDELKLESGSKAVVYFICAIAFMFVGRIISREKLFKNKIFDWLSILSASFLVAEFIEEGTFVKSLFFVGLALYFANFIRKDSRKSARYYLSLSTISVGLAIIAQELIDIPEIIYTEYILVIMLLVVFVLRTFVKPFNAVAMRYIWISFVAISIFVEATSAAITSEISDLLIVGVAAIGIFIYSFIRKEKAWFVLAMVTLCGITVYLAASFGNTWTWLIYLFVAGVILITVAMINEYGKRKAEKNGEQSSKRIFSEWKW